MRLFAWAIAAMLLVLVAPASARAKDSLELKPSSDWSIKQFEDRCRLSRSFGHGENKTDLWIEQGNPESVYNFILIGRPVRNPFGTLISVRFEPYEASYRSYVQATSSKDRPVIMLYGVRFDKREEVPSGEAKKDSGSSEETVDPASGVASPVQGVPLAEPDWKNVTAIHFGRVLISPLTLKPDGLESAAAKLRNCAEKVAIALALNSRRAALAGTPVKTVDEARWARVLQQNYPSHLLRTETEGRLQVMLTVNSKGKPTYCNIAAATRPQAFDDTVCLLLLQNAKFKPAHDEHGEPIAVYYSTKITFRLH